jgi:hypothetical protein
MYRGEGMARDIAEIMVLEGVGVVVGVAHDWYVLRFILSFAFNYTNAPSIRGSFLLSRLANYHPERFSAYVFIDHGYGAPGQSLTPAVIQHINSSVQAKLGFSIFGYFLFFNEEDAAKLLDEHVSSFQTSANSDLPNIDHTTARIRGIALLHHRQRDQQEIQGRPRRFTHLVDRG